MKKLFGNQAVRYLFFGCCTTAVNLIAYYLLCRIGINVTVANTLAILLAILFAYVVNKRFVFEHRAGSLAGLLKEAGSFIGMRLGTMVVEVLGVVCLVCIWGVNNMFAKLAIQVVILVLNYLISKFVVFKEDAGVPDPAEEAARKQEAGASRNFFLGGFGMTGLAALIGFMCVGVWPFSEKNVWICAAALLVLAALTAVCALRVKPDRKPKLLMISFALTGLAVVFAVIAWQVKPSGDKTLLIIDSIHQYLPFYTVYHEKLADSESFLYSFSGGLGYNFWSTWAYYMASPLNFLMAFIPTENVCDFMDLMILSKIALCGGTFSWYLHKRDPKRRFLPQAFGMMFALSNFILGYYFNLMWLDSIAMLPLILYGIEQIVKGKSGRMFGVSLFYGLWCNYYIGFMLCLFSCLYFLVCWIGRTADVHKGKFKAIGKSCLTFGWYALLSGAMSALVLLPAFLGLTSSESMESNTFPTTVKFYESLAQLLENQMAFMEPVTISSTQVGLNIYCGMAAVLLAVLYLFDRKIRLRERLAHYGLLGILLFSFSCNILNYIWHGFHVQNGLPNRFAFLYVAVLLVMAYDALGHIRSFWLPELLFSAAAPLIFLFVRLKWQDQEIEDWIFYVSAGLLLFYLALLLIRKYAARLKAPAFSAGFALALAAEITANAIYGIQCNGSVTRSIYLADQASYQTMMAAQNESEDSFYRSEVDRQRMRNVTMYCGGNSLVMFNSTMLSSFIDFCDALGIEARTNKNGYLGVTKLMNDVFGIKYVASPSKLASTMYQFSRVSEDGELALYKNDNALSLGFMVKDSILDWDTGGDEPLTIQNNFVTLATGLDPIFVLDRTIDMEDGQNYGIKIPDNKQVYLCIDTRVSKIEMNTPEYTKTFSDFTDHLYVINGTEDDNMADFTVELKDSQTTVQAEVYTCSNEAYQNVIDELSKSQLENLSVDGNRISGDIDVLEEGTLLLTIPCDEGWTVLVDGQETEYSEIGGALMGVHLTAGEHSIEMKYTPPGLWQGTGISLAALALLFLTIVWEKRHPHWFALNGDEPDRGYESEPEEADRDCRNGTKTPEGEKDAVPLESEPGTEKRKDGAGTKSPGSGDGGEYRTASDAEEAEHSGQNEIRKPL